MNTREERELRSRFRAQYGLVSYRELRALGVNAAMQSRRIAAGDWELAGPGVVRLAGAPRSPEQDILAACLAGEPTAVASHQSAAWIWGLTAVPGRHAVTVARGVRLRLAGVDVRRPVDYPAHVVMWRQIPCTDPMRALVDYSSVASPAEINSAVDAALAERLLTVEAIEAELTRLARQGRTGVQRLRGSLVDRGWIGAPNPSALESRLLRLLRRAGIVPLAVEVPMWEDGRYRVDVMLTPTLVVETDGYAYHHTPEQVTEDERRRRRLRLSGIEVLVYTWREVVFDWPHCLAEVRTALRRANSGVA
jgi:very-short-patch-repair endonuclease